ncbi:MAG TPA: pitrilysin family protein [Planctomycetota bacterium]|nr:pitrilysin family protein [Planctomycetota bacterium]
MNVDAVTEVRYDNGFRLFLLERSALPVVATVLWYQVGARDERTGESGLSHFLEHMMFKGTGRFGKGEIDLLTSKMGGLNNAFTDNDETVYHFALAADRWETALEIEADRMRGCLLDPAEFAAEKSVVLEELAMGEDDPWRMLHQAAEALVFQVHPYRRPVIGWREDLERVTHETMRAYYDRHYGPNRAFLVVAGAIDVERTERRVRELFGALPPSAEPRVQPLAEPEQKGERRAVYRFPGNLQRMAVAVRTCRIGEDDDLALDVASQVLGGGRTSRLYRRLVQRDALATEVHTNNETRQDPGVFWIMLELKPGASRERAEAAVREEVDRLIAEGPTAAELKRAQVQIDAALQFDEEAVLDVALKIGRFEAAVPGGYKVLRDLPARYRAVTARTVRSVMARYFASDRWNVVWSLPADARTERRPAPRKKVGPRRRRVRSA